MHSSVRRYLSSGVAIACFSSPVMAQDTGSASTSVASQQAASAESAPAAAMQSLQLAAAQQSQPEVPAAADEPRRATINDIIVTGTRIVRDGYQAPTPVTVQSTENLFKAAPSSLSAGIVQLPQFAGSLTPTSQTGFVPNSLRTGTILSLRGLGANRTLVMQDGFRIPPTELSGASNVDIIPQAVIERVDIVTAGASAAYGSDAVSGVVNLITRRKFKGFKVDLQSGVSTYGDNGNYRATATWGSDIGDRAHIVLSGLRYESRGFKKVDRPYLIRDFQAVGSVVGSASAPGTAGNPLIDAANVGNSTHLGARISRVGSYPASYFDLVFPSSDVYRPAIRGTPTGTVGSFIFPSDYRSYQDTGTQGSPQHVTQGFGRLSYDLTDDISMYVQGTLTKSFARNEAHSTFMIGNPIYSENPFIPAALHIPALDFGPNPAFFVSKIFENRPKQGGTNKDSNYTLRAGFDGNTAGFDWQLAYQRAQSKSRVRAVNAIDQVRMNAALDAVRDPMGNIVCRVTLDPDPAIRARYAGCAPLNPFGPGAESNAAFAYFTGTTPQRDIKLTFESIAGNFSRELFDLWGAGPLAVAAGAEYRKVSLREVSNFDASVFPDLTGLRGGIIIPSRHVQGDTGNSRGEYDIKEAFAEIDIPILKDSAVARSLDLNAAIRIADYSTSGSVKTWKFGGAWVPFDGLRFRATRSRDIRAPSLIELFQGAALSGAQLVDPHTNQVTNFATVSGGNPTLVPEVGNTVSFGLSAAPSFIPGFRFSVDYYKVKIDGAIQNTNSATILAECELSNGTSPVCASITRPLPFSDRSPANSVTAIRIGPQNIGRLTSEGVDFDADYSTDLGGGRLGVRLIANWIIRQETQASATQPVLRVDGFTESAVPKIRGNLQVNYDTGDFGIFVQERMIGKLKRGPVLVWAEPPLPKVFYTDATLTYRFGNEREQQFFMSVNNVFNKKAPIISIQLPPNMALATLAGVYDTVGRMFTAGVRMSF